MKPVLLHKPEGPGRRYSRGYRMDMKMLRSYSQNNVEMNFTSKDNDGQTPLSQAAENGHEAIVQLVLERNGQGCMDGWIEHFLVC